MGPVMHWLGMKTERQMLRTAATAYYDVATTWSLRVQRVATAAHHLSSAYDCSTMGNEDFHDVSLETQDGQPVLMNDTDREALVMGMTLHDKAQQFLQKVGTHIFSLLAQAWLL